MRCLEAFILLVISGLLPASAASQGPAPPTRMVDYSPWDAPEYRMANSASNEDYLTDKEKQVYYYLNLARMNPKLFARTYLNYLKNSKDYYERSLYLELGQMKSRELIRPCRQLFESAHCHASESGAIGHVGHERLKCKEYFMAECIHYGQTDAIGIVVSLLIDQSVTSLGHRKICLGYFTEMGVSIQPHKGYGENTVMDFR